MTEVAGIAPIPDGRSEVWWRAADEERLLLQRCSACGRYQYYPRGHCAACLTPDPQWVESSGEGVLHTFAVVRKTPNAGFEDRCPYVFAIVDLAEGVRITTNVIEAEAGDLRCDMPVRVVFAPLASGETAPFVAPVVKDRS